MTTTELGKSKDADRAVMVVKQSQGNEHLVIQVPPGTDGAVCLHHHVCSISIGITGAVATRVPFTGMILVQLSAHLCEL